MHNCSNFLWFWYWFWYCQSCLGVRTKGKGTRQQLYHGFYDSNICKINIFHPLENITWWKTENIQRFLFNVWKYWLKSFLCIMTECQIAVKSHIKIFCKTTKIFKLSMVFFCHNNKLYKKKQKQNKTKQSRKKTSVEAVKLHHVALCSNWTKNVR